MNARLVTHHVNNAKIPQTTHAVHVLHIIISSIGLVSQIVLLIITKTKRLSNVLSVMMHVIYASMLQPTRVQIVQ
jgi:hypothetical protein